jgi:hypothetical protein
LRVQFRGTAEIGGGGGVFERQHGHSGAPVESRDLRRMFRVHFTRAGFNGLLRFGGAPQERQSPRLVAANRCQVLPGCPFDKRIAVGLWQIANAVEGTVPPDRYRLLTDMFRACSVQRPVNYGVGTFVRVPERFGFPPL